MGVTSIGHVCRGAAQFFLGNFFTGNGLNNVRAGNKHLGLLVHHDDKVSQSRGVSVAAGTSAHDDRNLWNYTRCLDVLVEGLGNPVQGDGAFLDTCASTFIKTNQWAAGGNRQLHNLDHLFAVNLAQCATEYGAVLGENADFASIDGAPAGNDTVGDNLLLGHAEVGGAVLSKHVGLDEGAFVEQVV